MTTTASSIPATIPATAKSRFVAASYSAATKATNGIFINSNQSLTL